MAQPLPDGAALGGTHPLIELGELLHQYRLGLVLISGASAGTAALPVQWVHVSELEDPTPFLPPRTVLLTTGARFDSMSSADEAEAYVRRLVDADVTALGVGVGLHWDRIPARFVDACDRLGLPLFRVPYGTAFVSVVQTAARLLEAPVREREAWSLESQRAVTNASLHRDSLRAVVREGAARLGRWIGIADRSGRLIESAPASAPAPVPSETIRRESRRLIERGVGAGRIGGDGEAGLNLQTLGRQGRVLGVLVAEDRGAPDTAERALLGLVAALATAQLEHRSGIDTAQAGLRAAVLRLLMAGDSPLAEQLAADVLSRLPRDPVAVVRYASDEEDPGFAEDLRSLDAATPGFLSAVLDDRRLVVVETRQLPSLRRLLLTHGVVSGVSEHGRLSSLAELVPQADRAYEYALAAGTEAPVDYLPAIHTGVLHLLDDDPEARLRASGLLAPIRQHDHRHGDSIEESLRVWLAHHGQTSAAATELGIHRHTLKSRVQTAANLLQSDLDSPDTRAELWAALRLSSPRRGSGAAGTRAGAP